MTQNYEYVFYTPDGKEASSITATAHEAEMYNIVPENLLDIAFKYFDAHDQEYKNVMEVYNKCYFTCVPVAVAYGQGG